MKAKIGIKETKDVVIAMAKFGNAAGETLADGRATLTDLVHFYAPVAAMGPAVEGIGAVPAELADIEAAELADLQATFAREFDIPQNVAETLVEKSIDAAARFVALVLEFRKPAAA